MVVVQLTGVAQSPPMPATTPGFATALVREASVQIVEERTAALDHAIAREAMPFEGVVKTMKRQVLVGSPTDVLLDAATRSGVGLIVVGARGLGTLPRLLLGSVSENVLRHADRPVLIVKGATP